MKAALSSEAIASVHRWLHLWNTAELATRTTVEWSPRRSPLPRARPPRRTRAPRHTHPPPRSRMESPHARRRLRPQNAPPRTTEGPKTQPRRRASLSLPPPLPALSALSHRQTSSAAMALRGVPCRGGRRNPRHLPTSAVTESRSRHRPPPLNRNTRRKYGLAILCVSETRTPPPLALE